MWKFSMGTANYHTQRVQNLAIRNSICSRELSTHQLIKHQFPPNRVETQDYLKTSC